MRTPKGDDARSTVDGDESIFTANDILELAGLSYRQLNDWQSRGALPDEPPDRKAGWRRFTSREVFAIMVISEIRSKFGVPLDRLKYVLDFMGQKGADHRRAAVELMAFTGSPVWLMTDFESTFELDTIFEFASMFESGYFSHGNDNCFVLLNLTPLVNRLYATLENPPPPIKVGIECEAYKQVMEHTLTRPEELYLLSIIRSGEATKIEVTPKDGRVETIRLTNRIDPSVRIGELLKRSDYQNISVTMKSGRVVGITQEVTLKPKG